MMTADHRFPFVRWATVGLVVSTVSGCVVSKASYDELRSQHQAEAEARADAQRQRAALEEQYKEALAKLSQLESQLAESESTLRESRDNLDSRGQALAEIEHEHAVTQRRYEEAETRVDQLREELTRVASHLGTFAEERNRIAGERDELSDQIDALSVRMAELEAKVIGSKVRSLLVRDVSVALHDSLAKQVVRLGVTSDAVVLTTRADAVFESKHPKLSASGKKLISTLGSVLQARSEVVELEELDDAAGSGRVERLQAVAKHFGSVGVVGDRVRFVAAPSDGRPTKTESAPSERRLRIWIRTSDEAPATAEQSHSALNAPPNGQAG